MSAPTEKEVDNAEHSGQDPTKPTTATTGSTDSTIDIPGIGSVGMADYLPHPVDDAIATEIFKKWRKAGTPHNPLCYACREKHQGIAIGCMTCCRVYHPVCLPSEPQRMRAWHCPVCLGRGWDTAPLEMDAPGGGGGGGGGGGNAS